MPKKLTREQARERTKEQVKELTDMLDSGVGDIFQSDKYQKYLDGMAELMQFSPSRYSARNHALIQMQGGSLVAGFHAWRDYGRHVTSEAKGKGIKILAPAPYTITVEEQKIDPDTQAPLFDHEGMPVMEEVKKEIPDWKYVTVFDISVTDGKPLPHLAEDLAGNVRHYEAFMAALRDVSPLPIEFGELPPDVDGRAIYGDRIIIREGMSQRQSVSAAVHELGHATLHDAVRERGPDEQAAQTGTHRAHEIEAESISYIVCKRFGIETDANSFGYLASYQVGENTAELLKSLDKIQKTAAALIDKIDGRFKAICAERGIDITPIEAVHAPPSREDAEQFAGEFYDFMSGVTAENGLPAFSLDSRGLAVHDIADEIISGHHQGITDMLDSAAEHGAKVKPMQRKFDQLLSSTPWVFPSMEEPSADPAAIEKPWEQPDATGGGEQAAEDLPQQVRAELDGRGLTVSDEQIAAGLEEYLSSGGRGGFEDISDYIENEYLTEYVLDYSYVNDRLIVYNTKDQGPDDLPDIVARVEPDGSIVYINEHLPLETRLEIENVAETELDSYRARAEARLQGMLDYAQQVIAGDAAPDGGPEEPAPQRYVAVAEDDGHFVQDTETGGYYSENALVVWFTDADAARQKAAELNAAALAAAKEMEPAAGKEYELGYGHMGNGLTVWNRLEERGGDYVTVAHISPEREVTFYDDALPAEVKAQIERTARTSEMFTSATQTTPVFNTPAEPGQPDALIGKTLVEQADYLALRLDNLMGDMQEYGRCRAELGIESGPDAGRAFSEQEIQGIKSDILNGNIPPYISALKSAMDAEGRSLAHYARCDNLIAQLSTVAQAVEQLHRQAAELDKKNPQRRNTIAHQNYTLIERMFPEVLNREYNYLRLQAGDSFMPLVVERYRDTIHLMHYHYQEGDRMRDPDMELVVDDEAKTLQASTFEMSGRLYQEVYDGEGNARAGLQRQLNSFFNRWMKNVEMQGYEKEVALRYVGDEEIKITFDEDGQPVMPEQRATDLPEGTPPDIAQFATAYADFMGRFYEAYPAQTEADKVLYTSPRYIAQHFENGSTHKLDFPLHYAGTSVFELRGDADNLRAWLADLQELQAAPEQSAPDVQQAGPEDEADYEITYWQMGTGTLALHYFSEDSGRHGDYEELAHILPDRSIVFSKEDVPEDVKDHIIEYAATADIPNMEVEGTPPPLPAARKYFITEHQREQAERMAAKWEARAEAFYIGGDGWGAGTAGYCKTPEDAERAEGRAQSIHTAINALLGGSGTWADVQVIRQAVSERDGLDAAVQVNRDAQPEPGAPQPGYEEWSEAATPDNGPDVPGVPSDDIDAYLPKQDAEPEAPATAQAQNTGEIAYTRLENGIVALRPGADGGNHEVIARISSDRSITFTGDALPEDVKEAITKYAATADIPGMEQEPAQPEPEAPATGEADAPKLTALQQRAVEIARGYEKLPMQDRINIIAQAFGCKTGKIETSPCTGKWRGTSDISIVFDNGASLGIGNHLTRKAKTKTVQNEYINSALVRYNPEIIREAKAAATAALMEREAKDNAIAAEKGLKPYTFLNVEFADATHENSHLGWYYVTMAVDGKIFGLVETGLNHDIADGKADAPHTREEYFTAGALREPDVDFVFNNVGHSSFVSLYKHNMSDAARERAEQTLAQRLAAGLPDKQAGELEQAPEQMRAEPEQEADVLFPDPGIGLSERDLYGYTDPAMLPMLQERALELYDQDLTVYMLYVDGTEAMAFDRDEIEAHDGIFGIEADEWKVSRAYVDMEARQGEAEKETALLTSQEDCYGVYHVKEGPELRYHRNTSLEQLEKDGLAVERENYTLAYTAPLMPGRNLHDIYFLHSSDYRPDSDKIRGIMVGDIIVTNRDGEIASHYVDPAGFKELPGFTGHERQPEQAAPQQAASAAPAIPEPAAPQQAATAAPEPEAPAPPPAATGPSVAELDAAVVAGEQISLTDYTKAIKNERPAQKSSGKSEKPSIIAFLKKSQQAAREAQKQQQAEHKRDNDREV